MQALSAIGVVPADDIELSEVLKPDTTIPLLKDLLKDDATRSLLCPHLPAQEVGQSLDVFDTQLCVCVL